MAVLPSSDDDFRSVMASVDRDGRRRRLRVLLTDGFWRRWRVALAVLLIAFYLALPFLTINDRPLLRLDLPQRQFIVAGQVFWPQDIYYLLLLLLIAAVATLFTVAVAGRVFCGWLCPHSVFLETIFRPIERLVRGTPARRAQDEATGRGQGRTMLMWLVFAVVSGALANTAAALFIGTEGFRWGLVPDPGTHPAAALFWLFCAVVIFFNFAWLREQTCTIVCPYGRIQSVMLDAHSLVVAYDLKRGEPRGAPNTVSGDCIDCRRCVAVCPTGIDIRNGSQLECIHCAACSDACDGVMRRLGRATGLVRYASEVQLAGGQRRWLRPRTMLYGLALAVLISLAAWKLSHRELVVASRLRTVAAPVLIDGGIVRQILPLALVNRSGEEQTCTLALPADIGGTIILSPAAITLPPDRRQECVPVIDLPRARFQGRDLSTVLTVTSSGTTTGTRHLALPIILHCP